MFQLLIIGEAVKRLSPELRSQPSEIPWSLIARMRDNLIHRSHIFGIFLRFGYIWLFWFLLENCKEMAKELKLEASLQSNHRV